MNVFQAPYIEVENDNPINSVIGYLGNTIYSIHITNKVLVLSSEKEQYKAYHEIINQILATIGEGYSLQKTDIFSKEVFEESEEYLKKQTFLKREYSNHFKGRISKKIDTIISITKTPHKKMRSSEKEEAILLENVEKTFRILQLGGLQPSYLKEKDYHNYYSAILTQDFEGNAIFNNFKVKDDHIDFGDKVGVCLPFFDTEKVELPNEIDSHTQISKDEEYPTIVDNLAFLSEIDGYNSLVYTQYIQVPNQTQIKKELATKQNRHQGFSSEQYNEDCVDEINDFLGSLEKRGELIVKAHMNMFATTDNYDKLKELISEISSKMFSKGIVLSKSSYNQYELFRGIFLGMCATELKEYDLFTSTNNVAVAFFFKERFITDDESDFHLTLTDRQGIPKRIDIADLPLQKGEITNRNKIILGGSGTGKSFLMNNIFEQYLAFNFDIVVVDVGDSYSSLCRNFNGKYITYTEEKPISMNPFLVTEEELNEEKQQTLVELLWIIWKGADSKAGKLDGNIFNVLLTEYYKLYFNNVNHNERSTEELLSDLSKYGIKKEDLLDLLLCSGQTTDKTLYDLLEIDTTSSYGEIKRAYRNKVMLFHPDIVGDNYDKSGLSNIQEAYRILTDKTKKAKYDIALKESQKRNTSKEHPRTALGNELIISDDTYAQLRIIALEKMEEIQQELKIEKLNFNTLLDFAKVFMPIHLKGKKIGENVFDQATFFYNMELFYKGGKYDKILNEEVDKGLFDERLIIFEIDNIKDNPTLFPIVTSVIMDTFIQKMRHRKNRRKALFLEEAWKAIASEGMADNIKYLYKTVRKFWGEVGLITQDLSDIGRNEKVADAIFGSTDIVILLDQAKVKKTFDQTRKLLNISDAEAGQIFTINNLDNGVGRSYFKEFWMRVGTKGNVWGNEVSLAQVLTYTTEKPQKSAVAFYLKQEKDYEKAITTFIDHLNFTELDLNKFCFLINELNGVLNNAMLDRISRMNTREITKEQTINLLKEYA